MNPKDIHFVIAEYLSDEGDRVDYDNLDSLGTLDLISHLEDHYHVSIPMWDHKPPIEELVGFIMGSVGDYEDDGQPTERDEWFDYDPEC